ncbi:beta-ketoacyl synthase [uncultured Ruminococcus sp.]|uniref:beta-ketoacyl-[acyl-carrier-protein] synthase family protein n=1 Tax=uncultured Ruminococcus sp. TaxID=165186 RepID=UPI0026381EB9|nr:beta-ketoacyl-[acyl-carrier-protein] synthase family protein [uncultured Ruminococcus sp.]
MKKIVITGIGAVTSVGNTAADYWDGLISGKCGMRTITRIPIDNHDTTVAAEVDDSFEAEASKYWKKRQLNAATTTTRMGLASAGEAVTDCGVDTATYDGRRVGVIYGVIDNSYEDYELDKPLNITLKKMPNELPALVSIKYGFTGPAFNVSTACASSAYAIALGKQLIEAGVCDMVVAGGISNTVTHQVIAGFNQLLAMSVNPDPDTAARPFTKDRDGFIMGEGGGTVVLESEESAKARGAKIYCELAGAVMCGEAFNLTAPKTDGVGMAESMRMALANAGLSPDDVDYINAHGTSTGLNDLYETMAVKEVFGKRAYDIPMSSVKASIGHTLGAGGALEAIACIKAIETGIVPPTIHYDTPDPELDLNYVPNKAQEHKVDVAISNSFGFGGHNATLVLKRYEG